MKRKIISIIAIILMLIINIVMPSMANIKIESANLYSKGGVSGLLKYNGVGVYTTIVVHENNGVEYPAYCMNVELPGVGECGSYSVTTNGLVTNAEVWRVIANGYPYKSYSELGCNCMEEAYTATKQASYCILYGRDTSGYEAVGEAGERTLNALNQIVNTARSTSTIKSLSDLIIKEENTAWNILETDSNYIYKAFNVTAYAGFNEYEIGLEGEIPEGTKVTDSNNNEKKVFNSNEQFKIIMPLKNLTNDGNFLIKAKSKVYTKPVLYGESGNSTTQDYAITVSGYEDGEGTCKVYYTKNKTSIKIVKNEKETGKLLEGVKFNLLDENKNVIYMELETNEKGEIIVENLIPGKYYIQEIKTLNGYEIYNKIIEASIDLNEIATFNVVNEKKVDKVVEENAIETETTVISKETTKTLPVTGY